MAIYEDFILSEIHDFLVENIEEKKLFKYKAETSDTPLYYNQCYEAARATHCKVCAASRKMRRAYWREHSLLLAYPVFVDLVYWIQSKVNEYANVPDAEGYRDTFLSQYHFFRYLLRVYQVNAQEQPE